jgi:hypothetical protein
MDEILPASADLPDAFVRFPPSRRQIFENQRPQSATALEWHHASLESLEHGVGDLAEDIDLQLL